MSVGCYGWRRRHAAHYRCQLAVLAELMVPTVSTAGARRLEKLDRELRAWNDAAKGSHADVLQGLHEHMQEICVKIPDADAARASCDAFLKTA